VVLLAVVVVGGPWTAAPGIIAVTYSGTLPGGVAAVTASRSLSAANIIESGESEPSSNSIRSLRGGYGLVALGSNLPLSVWNTAGDGQVIVSTEMTSCSADVSGRQK